MIRIRTQNGRYFDINQAQEITRLDMPEMRPSGQWIALGVHEVAPFGRLYGREDLTVLLDRPLTFKNGKPRYRLRVLDHYTRMIWGDGIEAAWKIEEVAR
jgi:hypothetical protein